MLFSEKSDFPPFSSLRSSFLPPSSCFPPQLWRGSSPHGQIQCSALATQSLAGLRSFRRQTGTGAFFIQGSKGDDKVPVWHGDLGRKTGPGLILVGLPAQCLFVGVFIHLSIHPPAHPPATNNPSQSQPQRNSPSFASCIPSRFSLPPISPCVSSYPHSAKQPTSPQSGARSPRWSQICFGVRKKKKYGQMLGIGSLKFALQDVEPGEITPPLARSPSVCPSGC